MNTFLYIPVSTYLWKVRYISFCILLYSYNFKRIIFVSCILFQICMGKLYPNPIYLHASYFLSYTCSLGDSSTKVELSVGHSEQYIRWTDYIVCITIPTWTLKADGLLGSAGIGSLLQNELMHEKALVSEEAACNTG